MTWRLAAPPEVEQGGRADAGAGGAARSGGGAIAEGQRGERVGGARSVVVGWVGHACVGNGSGSVERNALRSVERNALRWKSYDRVGRRYQMSQPPPVDDCNRRLGTDSGVNKLHLLLTTPFSSAVGQCHYDTLPPL